MINYTHNFFIYASSMKVVNPRRTIESKKEFYHNFFLNNEYIFHQVLIYGRYLINEIVTEKFVERVSIHFYKMKDYDQVKTYENLF